MHARKYPTVVLLRDSDSIVVHSYDPVRSEPFRIDLNFDCSLTSILHGITDQVLEHPDQVTFFALHCRQPPECVPANADQIDKWELPFILRFPFGHLFTALSPHFASFRSRAALQLEILALRHQLGVLQRSVKRPKLTPADRLLWAWLCAVWNDWQSGVFIVKAATVIGWHRKGFRLFWAWKVRRGKPGRPGVPKEVRALIRTMSRENPLWGAPRIHGELLKLGIDIGETSVSKYLVRRQKPPSQTWRTLSLTTT